MIDLEKLSEQTRDDARRAKELNKALFWLEQADDDIVRAGAAVEVRPKLSSGSTGGDQASEELARHYQSLYPQAIAIVRELCRSELEAINNRYLPLLMPAEPKEAEA
ncbi:Hypothetical protein NGAL_HAMBI2605_59430 [Neorhizobium galegae bv. orientalis]|nr:Hypothetical protein NGAL_HAMBI2605_59430 [Neorhizobium galegae bv. orientalis]